MDEGSVKCDHRKWKFYEFWEEKLVVRVKWEKVFIFCCFVGTL